MPRWLRTLATGVPLATWAPHETSPQQPQVTHVEPDHGPPRTEVLIRIGGVDERAKISLALAGDRLPVLGYDPESGWVRTRIPDGARSGRLEVVVGDVAATPAAFFVDSTFLRPVTDADFGADSAGAWPVNQLLAYFPHSSLLDVRERLSDIEVRGRSVALWGFLPDLGLAQVGLQDPADDALPELGAALAAVGATEVMHNQVLQPMGTWVGDRDLALLNPDSQAPWRLARLEDAWTYLDGRMDEGMKLHSIVLGIQEASLDRRHNELAGYFDPTVRTDPSAMGLSVWMTGDCDEDPRCAHGTQVTSVVAGLNNGTGATGVLSGTLQHDAWVVVHGLGGERSGYHSVLFENLAALNQLAHLGSTVINASVGAVRASAMRVGLLGKAVVREDEFTTLQLTYRRLFASHPDVLFVVAAGNQRLDARETLPSAAMADNLMVVGLIDATGAPGSVSNWGPAVDLAAPGHALWLPDPMTGPTAYRSVTGTSFAAPLVAGAAALARAIDPSLSGAELKRQLVESGAPVRTNVLAPQLGQSNSRVFTRTGRMLDIRALVEAVDAPAAPPVGGQVGAMVAGPEFGDHGGALLFDVAVTRPAGCTADTPLHPSDFSLRDLSVVQRNTRRATLAVGAAKSTGLRYRLDRLALEQQRVRSLALSVELELHATPTFPRNAMYRMQGVLDAATTHCKVQVPFSCDLYIGNL